CVSVICHLMPHLVRHAYKQLLVRLVSTQIVFFFSSGRRYTIFSRDWSSDVCSSDLSRPGPSTGSPKAGAPASPSGSVWPTKGRAGPTVRDAPVPAAGAFSFARERSGSLGRCVANRTRSPLMSRSLTVALSAAGALALAACAYNETLGRNQFLIVDDSALTQQSEAAWAEALRTQPTSNDATANARVRRVGSR